MPRTRTRDVEVEATPQQQERGRRFAAWLKDARGRRGWNITQLHGESGVSKTYLGVLENDGINNTTGKYQRPSETVIARIAAATGADENTGRAAAGYDLKSRGGGASPRGVKAIYAADGVEVRLLDDTGLTDEEAQQLTRAFAEVAALVRKAAK